MTAWPAFARVRRWAAERPAAATDGAGWLALVVALVLALQAGGQTRPLAVGLLLLLAATLVVALRYAGYWSTYAYLAALAPVLCWYLDGWVGLEAGRVRWPGDPVGRLSGWVDARWPRRGPG